MTLLTDLADICAAIEAVPGAVGFRPHTVGIKKTSYTGSRPGLGTQTSTILNLPYAPAIKNMSHSTNDMPGVVRELDLKIGPISANTSPSTIVPSANQTCTIVISGSEGSALDGEYEVLKREVMHGRWYIHVRQVSR